DYASWKDRRGLAAAIKPIYAAPSAEAAQAELDAFADGPWGQKFPTVSRNLSAFLWARRLNNRLSARLRKSLAEQDSKLVHR
ncbi:hypothetical protein A8F36_20385, partial [Burkholderia cenocepacia]